MFQKLYILIILFSEWDSRTIDSGFEGLKEKLEKALKQSKMYYLG